MLISDLLKSEKKNTFRSPLQREPEISYTAIFKEGKLYHDVQLYLCNINQVKFQCVCVLPGEGGRGGGEVR